jgi:hypothetical protein
MEDVAGLAEGGKTLGDGMLYHSRRHHSGARLGREASAELVLEELAAPAGLPGGASHRNPSARSGGRRSSRVPCSGCGVCKRSGRPSGSPPASASPDRGPAFELRIETGPSLKPRPRPMKRWSQGELDQCRRRVAMLLDNGWIRQGRPSTASHGTSVVSSVVSTRPSIDGLARNLGGLRAGGGRLADGFLTTAGLVRRSRAGLI